VARARRLWPLLVLAGVLLASVVSACTPASPPPAAGVLAIGDSVMLGSAPALQAAIGGVEVDAVVSRQFHDVPGLVASRAAAGLLPATVIVHLGTNGTVRASDCDALLHNLGDRKTILVNNKVPRTWETGNNAELAACASRHGARLVDWYGASVGRPDLFAPDGYHPRGEGRQLYASAIAAAL
jgi:hypothetical protein